MALSIKSMGYSIYTGTLQQIPLTEKILINTINQYSYCIAESDPVFKKALSGSDILLPDGDGIVQAVRILTGKKIKKIAGADLHAYLLKELNQRQGRCFYLGSSSDTLSKIKERLQSEFPLITANYYSPPFKAEFSEDDNIRIIESINRFKPDVVFVGMTAPKQEKWAYNFKEMMDAKLICSIGAVFDFYARTTERPSKILIYMGLEWLGRLVKEPKRMWKRYLYFGPIFAALIFKEKFKKE